MTRAVVRRIGAAAVLVGLLLGAAVLAVAGGWPLPRRIPDDAVARLLRGRVEVDDGKVLTIVVWAWLLPALASAFVELESCIRFRPARRIPGLGPLQRAIGRLVTTAVLAGAPSLPRPALAAPGPTVVAPIGGPRTDAVAVELQAADPPERGETQIRPTHRAERFDTFIDIAEARLPGGASRWREVFELNRGSVQPSGRPLLQPDDLEEGMEIALPEDALGKGGASPVDEVLVRPGDSLWRISERLSEADAPDAVIADKVDELFKENEGRRQPDGRSLTRRDHIRPGWRLGVDGVERAATADGPPQSPMAPPTGASTAAAQQESAEAPPTSVAPAPTSQPDEPATAPPSVGDGESTSPPVVIRLPSASTVGGAFAAGALFAHSLGRIRRRRAYQPSEPRPTRAVTRTRSGHESTAITRQPVRQRPAEQPDSQSPPWVESRESAPLRIQAGVSSDSAVEIDPVALGVTQIDGSGAADAARAVVVTALLRCPPADLRVLVDAATASALFGPGLPPLPGLDIVGDAAAVLDEVHVERVRRTRIIEAAGQENFASYRAEPTDELLGALLVVGTPRRDDAQRWGSLADGRRLGIATILLGGETVGENRLEVAADGTVLTADGDAVHVEGAVLFSLTQADAGPVLREIAEARQPPRPGAPAAPAEERFPVELVASDEHASAPVHVRLLGLMSIEAAGAPVRAGLLDKARELCAYLALRPEGARRERILEDIWGDVDIDKRQDRFSAAVSSLRRCVRAALGRTDIEVVCCEGDSYRLEAELYDIDLWRFQSALAASDAAGGDAEALWSALAAYRGEFVQEAPWDWVEDQRENLRRHALNAAVTLAVIDQRTGRIEDAIAAVEHAIEVIDPYAEHLYVRGVELLVAIDRIESAQALYNRLASQLERIREEPMPDTVDAVGELLADGRRALAARRQRIGNG